VLGIDVDLDGARDGCWMVRDMPTVDDGKRHRREIITVVTSQASVERLWRAAGNTVQWRP
jgi:hypothetical protein